MRPHVELIQEADLCWHAAELPRGQGKGVRQRNLVLRRRRRLGIDAGPVSTRHGVARADITMRTSSGMWSRATCASVIAISAKGGYWRAPAGLAVPRIEVEAGTDVLMFREYGDWGFSVSRKNRAKHVSRGGNTASRAHGELTVVDSHRMEWMPNAYEGDTQRFLKLKLLYLDPASPDNNNTGFVTMLAWAPPGWSDNRMVHHPVFEEAYSLDGHLVYNFGTLDAGTYFFRPAMVKHGHFVAGEERGWTGFFRLDGSLINWITTNERVIVEGNAVNYDPKTQAPVIAGIPVRSRSAGDWDLDGQ